MGSRGERSFETGSKHLDNDLKTSLQTVESSMVRFHYGPWDKRYYHILGFLESRELVKVKKQKGFEFELTDKGADIARIFEQKKSFLQLSEHMRQVKKLVGDMAGTKLKDIIYTVFGKEVVDRKMGEPIS